MTRVLYAEYIDQQLRLGRWSTNIVILNLYIYWQTYSQLLTLLSYQLINCVFLYVNMVDKVIKSCPYVVFSVWTKKKCCCECCFFRQFILLVYIFFTEEQLRYYMGASWKACAIHAWCTAAYIAVTLYITLEIHTRIGCTKKSWSCFPYKPIVRVDDQRKYDNICFTCDFSFWW